MNIYTAYQILLHNLFFKIIYKKAISKAFKYYKNFFKRKEKLLQNINKSNLKPVLSQSKNVLLHKIPLTKIL